MKDITERLAEVVKLMEADFPINDNAFALFDEAIDTIRQLRKERDEAMRLAMSVLDDDFIDEAGNIIIEQPRKEDGK